MHIPCNRRNNRKQRHLFCRNLQGAIGHIAFLVEIVEIRGSIKGIEVACQRMKEAGAKRALVLPVGGAFHSPLMEPAKEELAAAIESTQFNSPSCPVYQNVVAAAVTDPSIIKNNLVAQLTAAVKWTQSVQAMVADGAVRFTEVGPGKVLQGLVNKISRESVTDGVN